MGNVAALWKKQHTTHTHTHTHTHSWKHKHAHIVSNHREMLHFQTPDIVNC